MYVTNVSHMSGRGNCKLPLIFGSELFAVIVQALNLTAEQAHLYGHKIQPRMDRLRSKLILCYFAISNLVNHMGRLYVVQEVHVVTPKSEGGWFNPQLTPVQSQSGEDTELPHCSQRVPQLYDVTLYRGIR